MKRTLSEEKVLKKLKIDNFRQLSKEKVITMISMLDKMDAEVAKKAIEQFPHFANTMQSILNDYKGILDNVIEKNNESVKSVYDSYDTLINTIQKELDKEKTEYSLEERRYLIDLMLEVCKLKDKKDTENKKFLTVLSAIGGIAVGVVSVALASALGTNSKMELGDASEENIDA